MTTWPFFFGPSAVCLILVFTGVMPLKKEVDVAVTTTKLEVSVPASEVASPATTTTTTRPETQTNRMGVVLLVVGAGLAGVGVLELLRRKER